MRATRLSKLLLKALRGDANGVANTPLTVQAVSGQTGNMAEFQNSTGTVITSVGTDGVLAAKDTNGLQRLILNGAAKTIVDGSATSLADVACASGAQCAGIIFYHVFATDGTDYQAMAGMVSYSAVNKAGTLTLTITNATANDAKAVSSGTLTLAWTFVTGTSKGTIKLQPTGSLTETTYTVEYTVLPLKGAVTIL
jgi:hypothetical protein